MQSMSWLIYPISIALTLAWVYYSKWQFSDDRGDSQGKWHPWGAMARALPFGMAWLHCVWQDVVLSGVICIILFEIGVNVIALFRQWSWRGETSKMDIKFGKYKWVIMAVMLAAAICIKIFV